MRSLVSHFRWPLFLGLAAFHLLVLPLVLAEPSQVAVTLVAGGGYLVLAALDRVTRRTTT